MKVVLPAIAVIGVLSAAISAASAGEAVGTATDIVRRVTGSLGPEMVPLALGDTVYRNQRIATAAESSALLTMTDESRLAMGPLSEVVLDDFAVPEAPRVVTIARGLFRFLSGPATGAGAHYTVRTPHVAIAVRGTRFDVRVTAGMTTVVLVEGAVDLCRGGTCEAMRPGSALDVTRQGIYPSRVLAPGQWTFDASPRPAQRRVAAGLDASRPPAPDAVTATGAVGAASWGGIWNAQGKGSGDHGSLRGAGRGAPESPVGSAREGPSGGAGSAGPSGPAESSGPAPGAPHASSASTASVSSTAAPAAP